MAFAKPGFDPQSHRGLLRISGTAVDRGIQILVRDAGPLDGLSQRRPATGDGSALGDGSGREEADKAGKAPRAAARGGLLAPAGDIIPHADIGRWRR